MTRTQQFLERLRAGAVLLADGATGTMLQDKGLEAGRAPESLIFERPDAVRELHQGYVAAGTDILLTCTFGGTRFRLQADGLDKRVVEVNRRAAELAREVAGESVLVAGDMGPTGELLAPLGRVTSEEVAAAYAEQAEGLTQGGADFLLIETMSDLGEARAAVEGARRASSLPVILTFSFDTHGRTMMGLRPAQAAREMAPLVEGLGANCGRDPAEYPEILAAMRTAAPAAILWAKPNAGLPRLVDDLVVYDALPSDMAEVAVQLRQSGARVVGGCCGTTPQHIAAMARALKRASVEV
ncbi:MAG TPA: homocysteine S-methyltransferase family protein [Anaerolineae bacterium]|nr:homocysteine S-methyltransferase family protein [Anaerolineae bacterium]